MSIVPSVGIVPSLGILRIVYGLAKFGQEDRASYFWSGILRRAFPMGPYQLASERGVNTTAANTVVQYSDGEPGALTTFLWVEPRRQLESVQQLEDRALTAANLSLKKSKRTSMYVLTTSGVGFRLWKVSQDSEGLVPLHGTAAGGDEGEYIDADTDEARIFTEIMEKIKSALTS